MSSYTELFIDQGATFSLTIDFADDITNADMNLYSYTARSQLRTSFYTQNASANLVCTMTDPANGEMTLSLSAANTANLKPSRYVFDLDITDGSGTTTRILEGIAIVNPGVTR